MHCRNVGKLNEGGFGYPPDPAKSKAAYERALKLALAQCEEGKSGACVVAGYMYRDGKGALVGVQATAKGLTPSRGDGQAIVALMSGTHVIVQSQRVPSGKRALL